MNVTTVHNRIGYTNNVEIIERALRERFGLNDNSYVIVAVAAHIWSYICGYTNCDDKNTWSHVEVDAAIKSCEARLRNLRSQLALLKLREGIK